MKIPCNELRRILELYDQGLYVQAYEAAKEFGALETWEGADALVLAGRLAGNLGAPKLASRLHVHAWRYHQTHSEATYFYARDALGRHGALKTLRFMQARRNMLDAPASLQGEWFALFALAFGYLRDFEAADEKIARAEQLAPDNAWVYVERAYLWQMQDRYAEALQSAERALALRAWYRPAVQAAADLLVLLDRDAEALELLEQAAARIESYAIVLQLANLQADLNLFAEARHSVERVAELVPLIEPDFADWLRGRESDAAYYCGDYARTLELAEQTSNEFFKTAAKNMREADETARRALLPVGFVRQHYMTCAPATLSAISRFWQKPADHLSVAEEICYNGTTDLSERRWAEQNDWAAREFTVTWDAARTLIDGGVPFTLTTVETTSAHLQAIIGYDERRKTFLIRDPYARALGEALAPQLCERYRSTGPRGMALVPRARADLIAALELPDAALYDQIYELQTSIAQHNRPRADEIAEQMLDSAPEHRLTWHAQIILAIYDADQIRYLAAIQKLLALFPDDARLQLNKLSALENLARQDERLDLLKTLCREKNADPIFWQQYAFELSKDARQHKRARRYIRRAMRARPYDPQNFRLLANLQWEARRFAEAVELYRCAACLDDKDEQLASSYFIAALHLKQTSAALSMLENRFRRFGKKSANPARTLVWAYIQLEQTEKAFAALEEALQLRPEDGDLRLYAADMYARYGDFERAQKYLDEAAGKTARKWALRVAATIADYRGDLKEALALWRAVAKDDPLNVDANRNIARLLAETESRQAALEFLQNLTARFRHNYALAQLQIEWLRDDPPAAENALRRLVEIGAADAWVYRELAIALANQRRFDEALDAVAVAGELEPSTPYFHNVRGRIYSLAGRFDEAKQSYRAAIRLSADSSYAIEQLIAVCHTNQERRAELDFIYEELRRQVTFGDGLWTFRAQAHGVLAPEELLEQLRAALAERPDLWHAWSAVVNQLLDMQRATEALELAREAANRFPLTPRVWFDLALIHRARGERDEEVRAMRRAAQISPQWSLAAQQLAEAYERNGEPEQARQALEQATARMPLDVYNQGCLADLLWRLGERETALARVKHALLIEPGYEWGWRALRAWSQELARPQEASELARELTRKRPGEARSWLVLAETLGDSEAEMAERLEAVERALSLNPYNIEAHSLRARLLAQAARFGEAIAACHPAIFGSRAPAQLRSAAAQIEAERGNLTEAMRQMRALVADEPDFYTGWRQLAGWYRTAERPKDYLEAAQALVRLAPKDETSFGYLGEAKLQNKDRRGAKEALRHALNLAPNYAYAARVLFDLQLEDGEIDAARAPLELLRRFVKDESATEREIKFALKIKDKNTARAQFVKLCRAPGDERLFLDEAVKAFERASLEKLALEILDEMLEKADANPLVGEIWAEQILKRKKFRQCRKRLDEIADKNQTWRRAAATFLTKAAEAKKSFTFRLFVRRHRATLHEDTFTWGKTGYGLFKIRRERETLRWFADWRTRADAQSWMLWNYALALRYAGDWETARAVSERALTIPPKDYFTSAHNLQLAFDEALAGETARAAERLKQIDASTLRTWDKVFYDMARILLDARRDDRAGMRAEDKNLSADEDALERLIQLKNQYSFIWSDRILRRAYLSAVRRLVKLRADFFAAAWAYLRLLAAYLSTTQKS